MTRTGLAKRRLVVESRHLDTDERFRQELEIDAPTDEASKRAQLSAVVGRLHPQATLRSFGNDAASFLGPDHLVVAHYAALTERGATMSAATPTSHEQPPLFAA